MQIYLPIAELSVNVLMLLALGGFAGLLSGLFGIGGGFIMTPLLIFQGIPPSVSVAPSANQIIASSFSGFLTHWRKQNVDFRMGIILLLGGIVGSSLGVKLFGWLQHVGQIDLFISVSYVLFLSGIGGLMAYESWGIKEASGSKGVIGASLRNNAKLKNLPWQMEFEKSNLKISILLPIAVGLASGALVSLMGIGGGFITIPAMIYILGMPASVVIGTSLFQIIFITAHVTFMHAVDTHTVDIVLAFFLLIGSVIGVQIGTRMASRVPTLKLRGWLAALVLFVAIRLGYNLFVKPDDVYTIFMTGAGA